MPAEDAVVLHDSNKLTLRLLPCDVLARVAPADSHVSQFELELAQQLVATGSPVAALEPRAEPLVHDSDGYVITLWTYYEPVTAREPPPAEYAAALLRLHAGMRKVDLATPHFTDRVDSAQRLVASRDLTPELPDSDRELLADTLESCAERSASAAHEQVLHGEPHPGNLLSTKDGLLFVDLETCCRGPVEFDLAHAPEEVGEYYPGVDQELLRECRILLLAMIIDVALGSRRPVPNGRRLAGEWLSQIRAALGRG